jgi:hypothetical protein
VEYEDGSFEPVNPNENINKKERGPGRPDWWVVDQTPDWRPEKFAQTKRGQKAKQEFGLSSGVMRSADGRPAPGQQEAFQGHFGAGMFHATSDQERAQEPASGSGESSQARPNEASQEKPNNYLLWKQPQGEGSLPPRPEDNNRFERMVFEYWPDPILTPFLAIYGKNKMRKRLRDEKEQYTDENDWAMRKGLEEEAQEYGLWSAFADTYLYRNDDRAFAATRDKAKQRVDPRRKE